MFGSIVILSYMQSPFIPAIYSSKHALPMQFRLNSKIPKAHLQNAYNCFVVIIDPHIPPAMEAYGRLQPRAAMARRRQAKRWVSIRRKKAYRNSNCLVLFACHPGDLCCLHCLR
jgi:hypothetical protein